jgi:hypothetical protein
MYNVFKKSMYLYQDNFNYNKFKTHMRFAIDH